MRGKDEEMIKLEQLHDEYFGNDPKIEENTLIRRKWQLQKMQGLRKVESKFRDLNMKHLHVTKTDLQTKSSKKYIEKLIVNKRPGIISQKTFISSEAY